MIAVVTFVQTPGGKRIALCAYDIGFVVETDEGTQISYMAHHDPDVFVTAESLDSVMKKVFEAQQRAENAGEPKTRPGDEWKGDGYENEE